MLKKIVCNYLFLLIPFFLSAQDVLLPLEVNPVLANDDSEDALKGLKSGGRIIEVDLDSSKFILIDDFSYNNHRPNPAIWQDHSVFINRNFPIKPITVGVATFDGLDKKGYPYNFTSPTSYGACDTLSSWPIQMSNVNAVSDDPVYLSFYYQPQGLNIIPNSNGDSLMLEFYSESYIFDTTGLVIIDTVENWQWVWGVDGYDIKKADTGCNFAFRQAIIKVDPIYYNDQFKFRFVSFGNTSGNLDVWHLDFVVMSSDANAHQDLDDYAFTHEIGSLIKEYESMPWFHYVGNESLYDRNNSMRYRLRNTTGENIQLDLEYRADNSQGVQVDSIIETTVYPVSPNNCGIGKVPFTVSSGFRFRFPSSSAPADSTTFFLKKTILKRRIGPVDIIDYNNQVESYQTFGTYYAYDDGSAEAGYGVKSDKGKVAVQYIMPPGIVDTLTSIYIHFNPVVSDKKEGRFRLTVWGSDFGKPGQIIYENTVVTSPQYPKNGVNYFKRIFLESPVLVEDTFYVGYQKITEDVLNIGYDLNRRKSDKLYFSIGGAWIRSSAGGSVENGSLMIRPSFRSMDEVVLGVKTLAEKPRLSFNIYPNPANDVLNIQINDEDNTVFTAQIFSLDGRLVNTIEVSGFSSLNVQNFEQGLYILRLIDPLTGRSDHRKFLVSK